MKKKLLVLLCLIMIFTPAFTTNAQDINEESMRDFILVFLDKTMYKAVEEYYGKPKMYDLYDAKILSMKPLKEGKRYSSEIKVQVITYVGAHNPPRGIETITMTIDWTDIKVTKFEHEGFDSTYR